MVVIFLNTPRKKIKVLTPKNIEKLGFEFSEFSRGDYLGRILAHRSDDEPQYCADIHGYNGSIAVYKLSGHWYVFILVGGNEETYEVETIDDIINIVKYAKNKGLYDKHKSCLSNLYNNLGI